MDQVTFQQNNYSYYFDSIFFIALGLFNSSTYFDTTIGDWDGSLKKGKEGAFDCL